MKKNLKVVVEINFKLDSKTDVERLKDALYTTLHDILKVYGEDGSRLRLHSRYLQNETH